MIRNHWRAGLFATLAVYYVARACWFAHTLGVEPVGLGFLYGVLTSLATVACVLRARDGGE